MQQTVHIVSRNHSESLKNNYEMGEKINITEFLLEQTDMDYILLIRKLTLR